MRAKASLRFVILAVLCLLLVFAGALPSYAFQTPAPGAQSLVFFVTTLNASGPGSLAALVENAPPGAIITFAPGLKGTIKGDGLSLIPQTSLSIQGPASKAITLAEWKIGVFDGGTLHLSNLVFVNSDAIAFQEGTTLEIADCIFHNMSAAASGGGTLTVTRSFIDYSKEGILLTAGHATVSDTTFSHIFSIAINIRESAAAAVVNSTFSQNQYAILNLGMAMITQSTFNADLNLDQQAIFNRGQLEIQNSILATQIAQTINSYHRNCNNKGKLIDGGGNLQSPDQSCGLSIPVGDPKLGPLQDNGGVTPTLALLSGSAAIAAGRPQICAASLVNNQDQRGYAIAPAGQTAVACDAGAFQTSGRPPIQLPFQTSTATAQ